MSELGISLEDLEGKGPMELDNTAYGMTGQQLSEVVTKQANMRNSWKKLQI